MNNISKANKRILFKGKTILVTIDFGKVLNYGQIRTKEKMEVKSFKFSNNRNGFQFFDQMIENVKKQNPECNEVLMGYESTGKYGVPLVKYAIKQGFQTVQVNPLHTKRVKMIRDNSPLKTDKKDPQVIGDLIELGCYLGSIHPEGIELELRELSQGRERLLKSKAQWQHRLEALVFDVFPELTEQVKLNSKTGLFLLKEYGSPKEIAKIEEEKFTTIIQGVSRNTLSKLKIQKLYKASKESIGIDVCQSRIEEIKKVVEYINFFNREIKIKEKMMRWYLKNLSYGKYLLSIKGIGVVIAGGIIGEIGEIAQFKTAREVEKYAGLNLYEVSSGNKRSTHRISKIGRPLLRKNLFFAALSTIRKEGILRKKYEEYLSRGMNKKKAIVAICRKILRIIFALVRDRLYYRTELLAA